MLNVEKHLFRDYGLFQKVASFQEVKSAAFYEVDDEKTSEVLLLLMNFL